MIHFIHGTLADIKSDYAVIDCGGVGFKLGISVATGARIASKVGKDILLYTYMAVSEDNISLYGFSDEDELALLAARNLCGVYLRLIVTIGFNAVFIQTETGCDLIYPFRLHRACDLDIRHILSQLLYPLRLSVGNIIHPFPPDVTGRDRFPLFRKLCQLIGSYVIHLNGIGQLAFVDLARP